MPTFTWNPDPVFIGIYGGATKSLENAGFLPIPVLYAMLAIAVFSGVGAFFSKRSGDQGGFIGSLVIAVAALVVGFLGQNWATFWEIRFYSLLFVFVFLGGYALLNWQIRRGGGAPEVAGDFIVYGVIAVLAGARLGHVIFYDLDKALEDPWWVFAIWTGGLASHGATLGLIFALWLFAKKQRVSALESLDRFTFSAALGATLVRLGNFLNSEIVGRATDGTWGAYFPKTCVVRPDGDRECWGMDDPQELVLRHPSQLYEVTLGLTVMLVLFIVDRAFGREKRPRGVMSATFLITYFSGRFIVEFWKEFQVDKGWESTVTMGQLLSLPGVIAGVALFVWALKKRLPVGWVPVRGGGRRADDDDDLDEDDDDVEERDADDADRDADVDEEFGGRDAARARRAKAKREAARKKRGQGRSGAKSEEGDEDALDAVADEPADEGSARPAAARRRRKRE